MTSSMTLDVVECEGLHLSLWVDVGHSRDFRTENYLSVVREEVQLKKAVLTSKIH